MWYNVFWILLGGVFIKVKVYGYIENIGNSKRENIDTVAIKNKEILSYYHNDIKHKIVFQNNSLKFIRENQAFIHSFNFKLNKETESKYYIKEYNTDISLPIITKKLEMNNNYIKINYLIKETNEEYVFVLEMSDK